MNASAAPATPPGPPSNGVGATPTTTGLNRDGDGRKAADREPAPNRSRPCSSRKKSPANLPNQRHRPGSAAAPAQSPRNRSIQRSHIYFLAGPRPQRPGRSNAIPDSSPYPDPAGFIGDLVTLRSFIRSDRFPERGPYFNGAGKDRGHSIGPDLRRKRFVSSHPRSHNFRLTPSLQAL